MSASSDFNIYKFPSSLYVDRHVYVHIHVYVCIYHIHVYTHIENLGGNYKKAGFGLARQVMTCSSLSKHLGCQVSTGSSRPGRCFYDFELASCLPRPPKQVPPWPKAFKQSPAIHSFGYFWGSGEYEFVVAHRVQFT